MTAWTIRLEPAPDAAIREAVMAPLLAYNEAQAGPGGFAYFAITVRDPADSVVGGLWGYVWHRFLFVEMLAMGAARGEGVGRQVMTLAERAARERGCVGIWLDTFTFQAPGFYAKLGYEEFGRIEDFPAGEHRLFLLKRLI